MIDQDIPSPSSGVTVRAKDIERLMTAGGWKRAVDATPPHPRTVYLVHEFDGEGVGKAVIAAFSSEPEALKFWHQKSSDPMYRYEIQEIQVDADLHREGEA